jgi:hypothetical protein
MKKRLPMSQVKQKSIKIEQLMFFKILVQRCGGLGLYCRLKLSDSHVFLVNLLLAVSVGL